MEDCRSEILDLVLDLMLIATAWDHVGPRETAPDRIRCEMHSDYASKKKPRCRDLFPFNGPFSFSLGAASKLLHVAFVASQYS
jgi:hypothetical protein